MEGVAVKQFPTLGARELVEERAELIQWLEDPGPLGGGRAWSTGLGPQDARLEQRSAPRWAASLRSADLTYVDQQFTRTALAAGDAFDDYSLDQCDVPSPHGLIVFEEPITAFLPHMTYLTGMPITAASWAVHGGITEIRWWSDKTEWIKDFVGSSPEENDGHNPREVMRRMHQMHPTKLAAVGHSALTFEERSSWPDVSLPGTIAGTGAGAAFGIGTLRGPDKKSLEEEAIGMRRLIEAEKTLVAAWALMQQTITVETTVHTPKASLGRIGRIDPSLLGTVRQVTLRHRNMAPDRVGTVDGPKREYAYRWCVKGHWRKRSRDPKPGESRKIWVSWHMKGPENAPILDPSKLVNVLRR